MASSRCFLFWLLYSAMVVAARTFTVLSVTPSDSNQNLMAEPITVVFSHAVIPFGSDIMNIPADKAQPVLLNVFRKSDKTDAVDLSEIGEWRYITTSIARFDLHKALPSWPRWPTDLYVEVALNTALTSATGLPLVETTAVGRSWSTGFMSWRVQSVTSAAMQDATDSAWTWALYDGSTNKYEVPFDGKVQVSFDAVIDLDLIKQSGYFTCGATAVTVLDACDASSSTTTLSSASRCVELELSTPLGAGEECTLGVSISMYYHALSGPFRGGFGFGAQTLVGPLPFVFEFLPGSNWAMQNVQKRALRLWIRHGLDESVSLQDHIAIDIASYTVSRPTKYMALLEAEFVPERSYTLSVAGSADIVDGLGQALRASGTTFTMARPVSNILYHLPRSALQLHPNDALTAFPVVGVAGEQTAEIRACAVDPEEVGTALYAAFRSNSNNWFCDEAGGSTVFEGEGKVEHALAYGGSGLAMVEVRRHYGTCASCFTTVHSLLSVADIHAVVAVSAPTKAKLQGSVDVMATALSSGAAVPDGSEVSLWSLVGGRAERVGEGSTVGGHSRLTGVCWQCVAVVEAGGALAVLSESFSLLEREADPRAELRVQLVLDRTLYAPGETATVSGWVVRKYCDQALTCAPDPAHTQHLALSVRFPTADGYQYYSDAGDGSAELLLDVNGRGLIAPLEFVIPPDAQYGARPTLSVVGASKDAEGNAVPAAAVTVQTQASPVLIADPRLPTALLALSLPPFLTPAALAAGPVSVSCSVETLTGLPLSGVAVTLRAELTGSDGCGGVGAVKGAAQATVTVDSNEEGLAVWELDASAVAGWTLSDGRSIAVTAAAVGPTGAPLSAEGVTMVYEATVELTALSLSVEDPLPDVLFDVSASLQPRPAAPDSTPLISAAAVLLLPSVSCSDLPALTIGAGTACSVSDGAAVTCGGVSFSSAAESIAVVVLAALDDGSSQHQCSTVGMPLVRAWRRTITVAAHLDSAGDVQVSFSNPFGARAAVGWMVWQDGHSGLVALRPEDSTVTHTITRTDSLAYGSSLMVQVYAWLPPDVGQVDLAGAMTEAEMSALLGAWGLLSYRGQVQVEMPEPVAALQTQVSVSLRGLAAPYVAGPEETVTVEIAAAGAGDGEAVVYIVDQALFELQPAALPDAAAYLGAAESVPVALAASSDPLSGTAVAAAADALRDMAVRDPFIPVGWTSRWLDGSYDEIVQGSEYQSAITYGNFPWTVYYPSYVEEDYLAWWAFRSGCPYTSGPRYEYDYAEDDYLNLGGGGAGEPAPSAPGGEADRGADGDAGGGDSSSSGGVTLREGVETVRTAVAAVVALTGGAGEVSVTLPADRKRWSVRVYVVADDLKFGAAETELTVRSDVYLAAFVPRGLRLTDAPTLGALVQTVAGSAMADREALVEVEAFDEAVFSFPLRNRSVSTAATSAPALFAVDVVGRPAAGSVATIDLRLSVGGAVQDRMRMSLAVDLHARPLLIATSRAVAAPADGSSGAWQDVLSLPERVEAESALSLAAAVSQYDRIRAHCDASAFAPIQALLAADPPVTPSADDVAAAGYCLQVVRAADRPTCGAGDCTLHNKFLSSAAESAGLLADEYTDSAGRLQWSADQSGWGRRRWVDVRLSAAALLMVRLTTNNDDAEMAKVQGWLQACVSHVAAMDARYPQSDFSWDAAHLWLAVSASPSPAMAARMSALPAKYRLSAIKSRVAGELSALSLLVNAAEGADDAALGQSLLNALRLSSDRTGYVAWPGGATAMAEPWQQLALLALCQDQTRARDERVWRVAAYIGQGGDAARFPWRTRYDTLSLLATGMALIRLDTQTDNDSPDVDVAVSLAGTQIWQVDLNAGSRSASAEVSSSIPNPTAGVLDWQVSGVGTVFTYLSAHLIPVAPWPTPISRGFQVQKFLQLLDAGTGRCSGEMVTSVTRGQLVCVSLLVTSADDVRNVRVEDWSASGLEPMDSSVAGVAEALAALEADGEDGALAAACPRWWGWCFSSETREVKASSVSWSVRGFFAGSREFSYLALANVPGTYVVPSAVATDPDNPSYTGMSGTAQLAVQGDAGTGGVLLPVPPVADARRNLLLSADSDGCPAGGEEQGGWCDEAAGAWMCGQTECGADTLPEGCSEHNGQIRCADYQAPPNSTPADDDNSGASALTAPLLVVTAMIVCVTALVGGLQ